MSTKSYGKTKEEKLASESLESRKIVKTIMDYGVSQTQILQICKLLSLELENTSVMRRVSGLISEILDGEKEENSQIIV